MDSSDLAFVIAGTFLSLLLLKQRKMSLTLYSDVVVDIHNNKLYVLAAYVLSNICNETIINYYCRGLYDSSIIGTVDLSPLNGTHISPGIY